MLRFICWRCCCCCRYGAALFIKPAVVETNAKLWAEFDQRLQEEVEQRYAV
jgi:hypothetical protein